MTFTSDSCEAMKHIEDLSPTSRAEEMEVVDKVEEEMQEEEMDNGGQSAEESVTMDADELEEGVKDELKGGEIIDSDTDPCGKITEVEDDDDDGSSTWAVARCWTKRSPSTQQSRGQIIP